MPRSANSAMAFFLKPIFASESRRFLMLDSGSMGLVPETML